MIGTFEKIGSVLGQDQDNFVVIPLTTYLRMRGARQSLTLQIKADGGKQTFEAAQDEARLVLRARRHIAARAATKISSSAPRTATSRCGRASARRSSPCSSW